MKETLVRVKTNNDFLREKIFTIMKSIDNVIKIIKISEKQ